MNIENIIQKHVEFEIDFDSKTVKIKIQNEEKFAIELKAFISLRNRGVHQC